MNITMEIEKVANRIKELYPLLVAKPIAQRAKEINDIIIYGDKITIPILLAAWDYYAYKKGVKSSF